MEIVFKEESYKIMGACFEVYKTMGCGFLEPVYQESAALELDLQGIPFVAQSELYLARAGMTHSRLTATRRGARVGSCETRRHALPCGSRLNESPLADGGMTLQHKARRLVSKYKPDCICWNKIVVELKAVSQIADEHRAQVHNYLKATVLTLGLLVNFGHHPKLEYERIVC